jgi:exoribonuclease-2
MDPGSIVEFFEEKRILCGVVLERKGERLHVLAQTGRELTLHPKRLLHAGPSLPLNRLSRQDLLRRLEGTAGKREALKAAINLEELWDLLVQEDYSASLAELAELWFGRADVDEVAATGRRLREERFLFKLKDEQVIANLPEVVAQLREQQEREAARLREIEEIGAWLQAVWEGREIGAFNPWQERVVALLRQMAVWGAEAPDYAQGKAYLDRARLDPNTAPFRLLVRLKVFQEDEDLDLHRLEFPLEFGPGTLAQARHLASSSPLDPYENQRRDLTDLEVITIDGERTRDYDDALSLEELPEGWRLGIHISDVSALVQPASPLDREALGRGSSIYLPERRLPMLPEEISENLLSLLFQQERRALSFLVTLSPEAAVLDWAIVPSLIKVRSRLTYHEVDALLARDAKNKRDRTLAVISRLVRRLKEERLAQGGYELKLPEVWVIFGPQGDLLVSVEDQETLSRQLVSEAMVLANSLAARFMAERDIPAVYRSQPEPREAIQPKDNKGLLELWQERRLLSRVVMDLSPQPHWGLGLSCYTLATSPIRRYLDLLTHRQIMAALCDTPLPYRREDLEQLLPTLDQAMRRAGQLKARRLRYWLLKYLAARLGQKKEALVLESLPHRYRLIFPDLLLELFLTAPAGLKLSPGDTILVRLDRVSPRDDQIKVSLA